MVRIKKAIITHLSFCPRGKNKLPVLYKSEDEVAEWCPVLKEFDSFAERGELAAVVYAPEHRDSDGHQASAAVIKEMAYSFQKNGGVLDIRHGLEPVTKSQAYVAETFIIQKGDPRFSDLKDSDDKPVDPEGAWAVVVKIDDPDLRDKYRSGEWGGVSMFGRAELEQEPQDSVEKALSDFAKKLENPTMDETKFAEVLQKALADNTAELIKALLPKKEEPKEAPKEAPKDTTVDQGIAFEGDQTNPEDVEKHLDKIKAAELLKGVDFSDAKSVEEYHARIAKGDETPDNTTARKVVRKSNQKTEDNDSDGYDPFMSKEDREGWSLGIKIAKALNGEV